MLDKHVADHESFGCRRVDKALGIQAMPPGYALMLDADGMYFYWLCGDDGAYSVIHWDKWVVRKFAINRASNRAALTPTEGKP